MEGNLTAIRILKELQEAERDATEEEKAALVRYVGWGAFAQKLFDANRFSPHAAAWRAERDALADLVTAEEWAAARASTLTAYYTSDAVIRGVWTAVQHLGFEGGRALEPAAGVGHFIGLAPEALPISWSAAELDPISGGIARRLYGGADIRVQGFESAAWPDGFFDLAISNVPFGDYSLRDTRYRPMSIHDYFFVKSLDKLRPGGLLAFVTSRHTLDKKTDFARREIAKRADFLGAIRLPGGASGAFVANAGTEATADIVFLRRTSENASPSDERWLELAEIETPDGAIAINRYFAENPAMMLGEMRLQNGSHGPTPVLVGSAEALDARIAEAASALPKDAIRLRPGSSLAIEARQEAPLKGDGAFLIQDGRVVRRGVQGFGRVDVSAADQDKLVRLIGLRDIVNDLLAAQAAREDGEGPAPKRQELNEAYDAFVSRYGPINKTIVTVTSRSRADGAPVILRRKPNFQLFEDDPDAYKVAALEEYSDATETAVKAAIFSHDIVRAPRQPEISGPADALALSLDARGGVDMAFIAERLGCSETEAAAALGDRVWLDPNGGVWRTAEDYLSGDVVGKLDEARLASALDPRFERNVAALGAVQPAPLTRVDIRPLFGALWIPVDVYQAFLVEKLGVTAEGLALNAISKKWQFVKPPEISLSSKAEWATSRSSVQEIVLAAFNNAEIRVLDANPDPKGSPLYNAAASEEGNAKVSALRELFSGAPETGVDGWAFEDEERAQRLEAIYNRAFNRLVPTVYDGGHLTMPGLARFIVRGSDRAVIPFSLRPHQLNAVWRIVSSGNTLLDHAVGAGKTFTMIAAGVEQKRLGLIARPMYVVPNHMLEQFSSEFRLAYPRARVLVADKDEMSLKRRRAFAAKAATGDWDGVVITHDAFGRIPMSPSVTEAFIREEIEGLHEFKTRAAEEEGRASPTVKELEKAAKRLEGRLAALLNRERKDEGITFEELGVDFLFIDEAHAFKNLAFQTRHTRVKGLAAGSESQRAADLLLKIRYLEERRPGRSVAFATGTPVSNSIAEMYTMQRYLQPATLARFGVAEFDAWAATFGDIVSQVELNPSGKGFRTTRSFSKFVNIPELIALYSRVADTQTAEMLNLPRPKLRNGAVAVVETSMSAHETAMMESLVARAEAIKGRRAAKGGDNMLKILGEGLQLATDVRLLDPGAEPNADGKISKAAETIARIWKEGQEPALSQIVFLDMGVPGGKAAARSGPEDQDDAVRLSCDLEREEETRPQLAAGARFDLYADLRARLIAKGLPREEIAFIHDADSDVKKARLFAEVRQGKVRILIGSTGKMGVGTNVQTRLAAMHHLDAPWRPADVEQRDGRILRQGNLNDEVAIYRYITLKSLDAYRWQALTTKANFIAQLRAGARGVRTAEDIDSPLPEAAMIKAAATGDARIMEHAELAKELRELEAARRAHERGLGAARLARERALKQIAALGGEIALMRKDSEEIAAHSEEAFSITLGHREVHERKAAGETIKAELLTKGARLWEASTDVSAGQLLGFEITVWLNQSAGSLTYALRAKGHGEYRRDERFQLSEATDAVGLIRRIEGLLRAVPKLLQDRETELAKTTADLPRIERQLKSGSFSKQERLAEVAARVKELEAALQPPPQIPSQQSGQAADDAEPARLGQDSSQKNGIGLEAVASTTRAGEPDHRESPAGTAARERLAQRSSKGRRM